MFLFLFFFFLFSLLLLLLLLLLLVLLLLVLLVLVLPLPLPLIHPLLLLLLLRRLRCQLINHFLQPSSALATSQRFDQQYSGTTNIAGPVEMSCCDVRPSYLSDVTADASETTVVAGSYQDSTYPTVCLYDNRPPTPTSSFRV